jgi:hypothetical protein
LDFKKPDSRTKTIGAAGGNLIEGEGSIPLTSLCQLFSSTAFSIGKFVHFFSIASRRLIEEAKRTDPFHSDTVPWWQSVLNIFL